MMEIRKATEQDRDQIAFVFADAFSHDWTLLSKDTTKVAQAIRNGLILDKYTVAVENGNILGFLALVTDRMRAFKIPVKDFQREFGFFKGCMMGMAIASDMEKEVPLQHRQAYIDIVGVCKQAQHQGIASKLLSHIIQSEDFDSYLLTVTNINQTAMACYQKMGFHEARREKVKYAKQKGFSEYIYMEYKK